MALMVEIEIEPTSCAECGVAFAMPAAMMADLRRTHRSFTCPNGHALSFRAKSQEEELGAKLRTAEAQLREIELQRQRNAERTAAARAAKRSKLRAVS